MSELEEGLSCINSCRVTETLTPECSPTVAFVMGMQAQDGIRCGVMEGRFARRHNCGDAIGRLVVGARVGTFQRDIGVLVEE